MAKLLSFDKKSKTESTSAVINEVSTKEIAIIGMAMHYPKAANQHEFWSNLIHELDCSGEFPEKRRENIEAYLRFKGTLTEPVTYFRGTYLEEIDEFDYAFFGITPKEADLMDPNQRLFLQTAWKAIEDAGYGGKKWVGSKTGVIVSSEGAKPLSYQTIIQEVEPESTYLAYPGNSGPMTASRISYLLDLHGPTMMIDTSCSSSLSAVNAAVQLLRSGQMDQAIVGAIKLNLFPVDTGSRVGMESSDGRTRTFSDNSDGTAMGEGSAALILKPLSKAVRDEDHIYAVIKGSASNNDGRAISITAPNPITQEAVIVDAWRDAGIDPEHLSYMEAHGTATQLGDPIEISGMTKAFQRYTDKKQFCAVGSVKSNYAHTYSLAGITGVIKAALSLQHKQIPASLHFDKPNHNISFEESPLYINDQLTDWESDGRPRLCGVSSFGMSGTNCHIVLEEAPPRKAAPPVQEGPHVLVLSAKTETALRRLLTEYVRDLTRQQGEPPSLRDICYTASTGREHYPHRIAMVAEDMRDLHSKLLGLAREGWEVPRQNVYYQHAGPSYDSEEAGLLVERVLDADEGRVNLLKKLAELYVRGADPDWDKLYSREAARKVSLPTYPFDRIPCWIDIPEASAGGAVHPEMLQTFREIAAYLEERVSLAGDDAADPTEPTDQSKLEKWLDACRRLLPGESQGSSSTVELTGRADGSYTQKEREIAVVWQKILGSKVVDIHEDFFERGGDSFTAIQFVSKLHSAYQVALGDIFTYRTVHLLAKNLREQGDTPEAKLERLKKSAQAPSEISAAMQQYIQEETGKYEARCKELEHIDLLQKTEYAHILLTGATGYLGIHLLSDLLKETNSHIHVLVRGKTQKEAEARLADKWIYYFGFQALDRARVTIVRGDLVQDRFGLADEIYDALAQTVDCIIHSAAIVKHFGDYSEFEELNVQGTRRIIRFAQEQAPKAINFISTTAVSKGRIQDRDCVVFTEYDHDLGQDIGHPYGESKLEAEKLVVEARSQGLNCHIYRVGNIMGHSVTGRFQENMEDNGLYTIIRSMIKMGMFPGSAQGEIDFTYIDYVSRSICLLFNRQHLSNETFHLMNLDKTSFLELGEAARASGLPVSVAPYEEFIDFMSANYGDEQMGPHIHHLLLHFGFFEERQEEERTHSVMLSGRTEWLLQQFGLVWRKPDPEQLKKILDHCVEVQFI
ncbi:MULTISPECIES: thioester reductase domain-containing protein [Paenibacillus]|uniref:thioester reductase domain-containing protein n=1 Tax=Paenibacillus TaxID=44249 RepID=UPI0022B85878|nr:thioester reductase domain-containing protein [Paenibacillus caseinilyticus]MCZ8521835.1 thioester reductase domain-containing protein [Paenibacillus caseinilyticus]